MAKFNTHNIYVSRPKEFVVDAKTGEDNYPLKDKLPAEDRVAILKVARNLVNELDMANPIPSKEYFKEATIETNASGKQFSKLVENGAKLEADDYALLSSKNPDKYKGWKQVTEFDVNPKVGVESFTTKETKEDVVRPYLELKDKSGEAIRFIIKSDTKELSGAMYNENANFDANKKPLGRWVGLKKDMMANIKSDYLKYAVDTLSPRFVYARTTTDHSNSVYSKFNEYIKEHTDKITVDDKKKDEATGEYKVVGQKEVSNYYCSYYQSEEDKAKGIMRSFTVNSHSGESFYLRLEDNEVTSVFYQDGTKREDGSRNSVAIENTEPDYIAGLCKDKGLADIFAKAYENYENSDKDAILKSMNDGKEDEFVEIPEEMEAELHDTFGDAF